MDTALITFMVQTSPYTQSVHLIGSWDNFSKHYHMERDSRRSRGQWRGCYAFTDIICDGDGANGSKRTGGLKMGSTYYYYYELDNGTEVHDPTVASTTACPFLPGQPVNLLSVPIEIITPRHRSASMSSMENQDIKTMNPADKFVAPRPPPPTPIMAIQRATTSPSPTTTKRSARSVSPKCERTPWSPRSLFGRRSPHASRDVDSRGRSASLSKAGEKLPTRSMSTASTPSIRRVAPVLIDIPPQSSRRCHRREPSPPRSLLRENNPSTIVIPDDIAEDGEDDHNFASNTNRASLHDREIFTALSPPPSGLRSPPSRTPLARSPIGSVSSTTSRSNSTTKPLPGLPVQGLIPQPLRLRASPPSPEIPRSHFSTSTMSSSLTSPFDSQFPFHDHSSVADSIDEEELVADSDSGEEFMNSPVLDQSSGLGFTGYSLPEDDCASEHNSHKEVAYTQLTNPASRATFGGNLAISSRPESDLGNMSALEELLSEVGYLGDVIVGK